MSEPGRDRYLDSGAYAADALPAAEVAAFEAALAGDPALAAEVESLQATTARMGLAAAEPAPATLRASVMAEIDRTRQDVPAVEPNPVVVPLQRRSASPAARGLVAAAALLAVLTLGLSTWVVGLRNDNAALTRAGEQVSRVLTAPDARTASAAVAGQQARGAVVVSASLGEAVFVADDLQAAPAGETYQLWFVNADGSAASAGTFAPHDGDAAVPLVGSPGAAAAVGMTLEPAGGSPQPTTQPVLAIPLA